MMDHMSPRRFAVAGLQEVQEAIRGSCDRLPGLAVMSYLH